MKNLKDWNDVMDYERIEWSLLAQGEPHSRRGAAAHADNVGWELVPSPVPVSREDVVATIEMVLAVAIGSSR